MFCIFYQQIKTKTKRFIITINNFRSFQLHVLKIKYYAMLSVKYKWHILGISAW